MCTSGGMGQCINRNIGETAPAPCVHSYVVYFTFAACSHGKRTKKNLLQIAAAKVDLRFANGL